MRSATVPAAYSSVGPASVCAASPAAPGFTSPARSVSLDWTWTPEGQGILAHLTDPGTGVRKLYGFLERPTLPPTVRTVGYKLCLSGKAGAGKTSLVAYLAGQPAWTSGAGETPGVRATTVYWPTRIHNQLLLFELSLWDCGDASAKKYGHVGPVCRDGAQACICVFSFADRSSFDDLDSQLARILNHPPQQQQQPPLPACAIVVGTRYADFEQSEVSQADVAAFEAKWRIPILRIRPQAAASTGPHAQTRQQQQQQQRAPPNPQEAAVVLNLICDRLWSHSEAAMQQVSAAAAAGARPQPQRHQSTAQAAAVALAAGRPAQAPVTSGGLPTVTMDPSALI